MDRRSSWQCEFVRVLRLYFLVAVAVIPVGVIYAMFTIFVWNHWIVTIFALALGLFCGVLIWGRAESMAEDAAGPIEFSLLSGAAAQDHELLPPLVLRDNLVSYIERRYIDRHTSGLKEVDKYANGNKTTSSTFNYAT